MKRYTAAMAAMLIAFFSIPLFAQTVEIPVKKSRGTIFMSWGYHRDQYTRSTIHFADNETNAYNFTLHHAKAKDQPDWNDFFKTPLTVPQYIFSGGYFFNDRHDLGVEVSWNHLKYVVRDNQMMHLTGTINEQYFDTDTLVTPAFVHYEHTNGNNYLIISLIKRMNIISSRNGNHKANALFRVGGGALIPKTDSYVIGKHNDGPFRVAGYVLSVGVGVRYDFFRFFFIEPNVKESFANYVDDKLYQAGRAEHSFFSTQYIVTVGFNYPL